MEGALTATSKGSDSSSSGADKETGCAGTRLKEQFNADSMKRFLLMAVAVSMLTGLTSVRAADDADAKKEKAAARRAEMIKKYDKNGDGKLDAEERAAMREDQKKNKKEEPKKEAK